MEEKNYCGVPMTQQEQINDLYRRIAEMNQKFPYLKFARGEYSETVVYHYNDWVTVNGSSYLYKNHTDSVGIPVTNTSYWQMIAEGGKDGTNGVDGNGISSIFSLSHHVDGDETITNVEVSYTQEGKSDDIFDVHAKNGKTVYQYSFSTTDSTPILCTFFSSEEIDVSVSNSLLKFLYNNQNVFCLCRTQFQSGSEWNIGIVRPNSDTIATARYFNPVTNSYESKTISYPVQQKYTV